MLSPDQLQDLKPLAAGLFIWLSGFFFAADRQSKLRRQLRSKFISRLKKDNGGKIDLSAYGAVGTMSFMRNQPEIVNDPAFIRADRTFLNYVEQAPALLTSLAMFSLVVDVRVAGYVAIAYSLGRLLYYPLVTNSISFHFFKPLMRIFLVQQACFVDRSCDGTQLR